MSQAQGTIVQCIGAVIDIQFSRDAMPGIYDARCSKQTPPIRSPKRISLSRLEQQLGDGVVRCIALGHRMACAAQ